MVEALCPVEDPPGDSEASSADLWGALLAAQSLWETGLAEPNPNNAPRNEKKRRHVQCWMRAIVEGGSLPPSERAIAGSALALLGDERDFDEWISIPQSEFWMGDDGDGYAKPKHRLQLSAFKIGKYPVTNRQFLLFARATGYSWDSSDARRKDKANHPVCRVSWNEAKEYCAWLTRELRANGTIDTRNFVDLPSEAQWERAARGIDGRSFPWGEDWRKDCTNAFETGIGEPCTVGLFPKGCSEEGCFDMAGNLWECTRSLWGKNFFSPEFVYPYDAADFQRENPDSGNEILRVVRGGSWYDLRGYARCAYRFRLHPVFRRDLLGFRVVLRSAPVS